MKKLLKKSIACLIAVLMVFSAMPLSAFAWDIGNLTFVKKDTSWDGYAGRYSAYVHNGKNNDFIGIVLKEVPSNGVIEVRKGSSFDITLSCGTWTTSSAKNGTLPNNTLSWHYGNKDANYAISSVDNEGKGLTHWKAFLGNDTTKEIQSAVEGEFATADTPSNSFRAQASEGGTNEAYGVFKFTPTSFSQLNTPGVYTVRLAPTLVMNHKEGWFSKQWQPKYGWGNYQWSIDQGSPDTSRTIEITVKVVEDYNFVNAAGDTVKTVTTTNGASDAYKQRPDNTANSYTSNKNGTHDIKIYSWPTSPSGTTFNETYYTVDDEICSGGTATCTTKKVCQGCGVEYGDVDSSNHTGLVSMPGQDATCSTDGYSAYQHCNACGKDVGKNVITATNEHNFSVLQTAEVPATCTTTGTTAVYKCATCELTTGGATIPAKGHSWGKPEYNEETKSDVFTCEVCGDTNSKTVADMSALNEAIVQLEAIVNAGDAEYKYEANALASAKSVLEAAKAYAQSNDNRYAEPGLVDAETKKVLSEKTTLITNGLAKYTITFEIFNEDSQATVTTYTEANVPYGETITFNKDLLNDENGNTLYVVYKWTKKVNNKDSVVNAVSKDLSVVVKENATYYCNVLNFNATTEGEQQKTRVRFVDKSGRTLAISYAELGSAYDLEKGIKDSNVEVPAIPYYDFKEWKCVSGNAQSVDENELVFRATYEYSKTEANQCQIVGRKGALINGASSYTGYYDEKVTLTGGTHFAICNENGDKIADINNNYIYVPHINAGEKLYITVVETASEEASTAITGYFTQEGAGGTTSNGTPIHRLYINAQYYLPENATAVEAGFVLSRSATDADTLQIGKDKVSKLVSESQGANHEYTMYMGFTTDNHAYVRSYLIYLDKDGISHTVYSDVMRINYSVKGGADNE